MARHVIGGWWLRILKSESGRMIARVQYDGPSSSSEEEAVRLLAAEVSEELPDVAQALLRVLEEEGT